MTNIDRLVDTFEKPFPFQGVLGGLVGDALKAGFGVIDGL